MDLQPVVAEVNFTTPLRVKAKKSLSSVMRMMMNPTGTKKQPGGEAPAQMIPEETTTSSVELVFLLFLSIFSVPLHNPHLFLFLIAILGLLHF